MVSNFTSGKYGHFFPYLQGVKPCIKTRELIWSPRGEFHQKHSDQRSSADERSGPLDLGRMKLSLSIIYYGNNPLRNLWESLARWRAS